MKSENGFYPLKNVVNKFGPWVIHILGSNLLIYYWCSKSNKCTIILWFPKNNLTSSRQIIIQLSM